MSSSAAIGGLVGGLERERFGERGGSPVHANGLTCLPSNMIRSDHPEADPGKTQEEIVGMGEETHMRQRRAGSASTPHKGDQITRLEEIRESLGLSQEELAGLTCTVTTRAIRQAEAGHIIPYPMIKQILEVLNVLLFPRNAQRALRHALPPMLFSCGRRFYSVACFAIYAICM